MSIKAVKLIIESDMISMFGGGMINPPKTLVGSVDQELAGSGMTTPGEFESYVSAHGLGQPQVVAGMSDGERLALLEGVFPGDRWACSGGMTEMTRYNVVVAFH